MWRWMEGRLRSEGRKEHAGMGSTIGDYNGDGPDWIFSTQIFGTITATLLSQQRRRKTFDDLWTFAAGAGDLYTNIGMGNDVWTSTMPAPDLLLVT